MIGKSRLEKMMERFTIPEHKSEYSEQVEVMDWARKNEKKHPPLEYLFHIPNGGHRSKVSAARLKRAGVKRGVPDLFLPCPRKGYHGLFIEMKKTKGGNVSREQLLAHTFLNNGGYAVRVCAGADKAINTICDYLNIPAL